MLSKAGSGLLQGECIKVRPSNFEREREREREREIKFRLMELFRSNGAPNRMLVNLFAEEFSAAASGEPLENLIKPA